MPANHFLNTPEALLGRNDSKNPATTCRGITSTGRPCRRALALSKNGSGSIEDSSLGGVVALLRQDAQIADARYYCWQHKDQAEAVANNTTNGQAGQYSSRKGRKQTELLELKNRSSIDTLVQRLGIQSPDDVDLSENKQKARRPSARPISTSKPSGRPADRSRHPPSAAKPRTNSFWASLCCISSMDDDNTLEVVRRRKRPTEQNGFDTTAALPYNTKPYTPRRASNSLASRATTNYPQDSPLKLIPPETSPQIAANLLAELSKPVSLHDEDGYIYIFWLTPSDRRDPGETIAQALLAPGPNRLRRVSDVITEFSYSPDDSSHETTQKTILLKIGRANNVTRRMNEWQRQCGHRLNLVRWYPYAASSSTPSPLSFPEKLPSAQPMYPDISQHGRPSPSRRVSSNVRKVPNVKRVERLIHLELASLQAKQLCEACGREHREWFKVEASESGIRKIDSIVRRWVDWSEQGSS